ncbi:MAG: type I-B CRISPR-associated protein Cas7/Csh2 [Candidatus Cloacimonetes bacterium]|nr:type I-B CRISPR-associated protein Cas7/Csh2 [Candidatus Cloacimonadota bacterium]
MNEIKNRSEILFLYDIQNANPNGDPNDENKPRIDEETGRNLVTDVRLKRTIRDYINEKGNDIFVREVIYDNDGHIQDAKLRAADYLPEDKDKLKEMSAEEQKQAISKSILAECIDVRLFGATIPLDLKVKGKSITSSITWTGPVQFKMGKSLHSVKIQHIKGTGAFASKKDATQKTFREEDILPYSLIGFYGIVNENAATHTNLQTEDITLLKDAIWNGTKGLISRSKFGQMPRLLMFINYKETNFFIGDLDNLIKLKSDKRDEQIRQPEDYKIDISKLLEMIELHSDKIETIEFKVDGRMKFMKNDEEIKLSDLEKFTEISL